MDHSDKSHNAYVQYPTEQYVGNVHISVLNGYGTGALWDKCIVGFVDLVYPGTILFHMPRIDFVGALSKLYAITKIVNITNISI